MLVAGICMGTAEIPADIYSRIETKEETAILPPVI
jgi:hypothetical protein